MTKRACRAQLDGSSWFAVHADQRPGTWLPRWRWHQLLTGHPFAPVIKPLTLPRQDVGGQDGRSRRGRPGWATFPTTSDAHVVSNANPTVSPDQELCIVSSCDSGMPSARTLNVNGQTSEQRRSSGSRCGRGSQPMLLLPSLAVGVCLCLWSVGRRKFETQSRGMNPALKIDGRLTRPGRWWLF